MIFWYSRNFPLNHLDTLQIGPIYIGFSSICAAVYQRFGFIFLCRICCRKKVVYRSHWHEVCSICRPYRDCKIGERSSHSNKFYIRFRSSRIKYYVVIKSLNDIFMHLSIISIFLVVYVLTFMYKLFLVVRVE